MSKPESEKQRGEGLMQVDPRLFAALFDRSAEDRADLLEYWWTIWKHRMLIIFISIGVGLLAAAYSLTLPNIYKGEVLLAGVSAGAQDTNAFGDLGSFASLAGALPIGGESVQQNLAVLKSHAFLWSFIKGQKLMPVLFENDWDNVKGAWKDSDRKPTLWDAYRSFRQILDVSVDQRTGLVTVAVEWRDAAQAAKWANALIASLNDFLRKRAIAQSEANLKYLNRELARTSVEQMRQSLFGLILQQQKNAMLANTRRQYAFRILDPAAPPDTKYKPRRTRIVYIAMFVGGFVSVLFVLMREMVFKRNNAMSLSDSSNESVPNEAGINDGIKIDESSL